MVTVINHKHMLWSACVGFRFLFDLSGNFSPVRISHRCETSFCFTCYLRNGSIRVFITGMWKVIGCDGFAYGFRFDRIFLRFWMIFCYGFAVSNRPHFPVSLRRAKLIINLKGANGNLHDYWKQVMHQTPELPWVYRKCE